MSKIRLFTSEKLATGQLAALSKEQSHYLLHVMRRRIGDKVLIFNGIDGEFLAELTASSKKNCSVHIMQQTRPQSPAPDIGLYFAPVKNAPIQNIVQKATELGASFLQPIITQHTIVTKVNIERLTSIAIEAAEQSQRIDVPKILQPIALDKLLTTHDVNRRIILCDESGQGKPLVSALQTLIKPAKYAVLVGPEGGFAQSEFAILRNQPYIVPVTMGPRILRADTAAIVALSGIFSILGDWDEKPNFGRE